MKPAHERAVVIAWERVGLGVQRGHMEDPPGWLFVKETIGGGAALCFVPDPAPVHDPATCHVCRRLDVAGEPVPDAIPPEEIPL